MFKKIILFVFILIAGIFGYAAMQPAEMMVARELLIQAPPQAIFPHINNNKKANEWMPWAEQDPKAVMTYSGPEEGVGATSSWDSPGQMGTGQAKVVESVANQKVVTELTYTKPMQMQQMAEVSLTPTDGGTNVRWSVSGKNSLIGRVMCLFMNMDKLIGGEFEKGLKNLKVKVEGK